MLVVSKEKGGHTLVIAPLLANNLLNLKKRIVYILDEPGLAGSTTVKQSRIKITDEHAALIVDFVTSVLDVMPKSISMWSLHFIPLLVNIIIADALI